MTALHIGKFQAPARFHVIDVDTSYHLLVERARMQKFGIIPSIYHQCMKGNVITGEGRKVFTIVGTHKPFGKHEAHMVKVEFFSNLNSEEKMTPPNSPHGIAIPK